MKTVYLVLENRALANGSIVLKAFSNIIKANRYAKYKTDRTINYYKPNYDSYGLCHGIEYIVTKLKVK